MRRGLYTSNYTGIPAYLMDLFHGYEVQLPAYMTAEKTYSGIYMVVKTEKEDDGRCRKLQQYFLEKKDGIHSVELIIVDARKRPSASVL